MRSCKVWLFEGRLRAITVAAMCVLLLSPRARAKEVLVSGVELFGPATSPAYAQLNGITVNGKIEMRRCSNAATTQQAATSIDKNSYKSLAKVSLSTFRTLERLPNGMLVAEIGDTPAVCVVPGNFKFDKDASLTPSQMVDHSMFQATVLASAPAGATSMPPFNAGAKIVFVAANDTELAEFLRADRAQTISVWRTYLAKYSAPSHHDAAQKSLANLLAAQAAVDLAAYQKTAASTDPAYNQLKAAKQMSDEALTLVPGLVAAATVRDAVRVELGSIAEKANGKLAAYRKAMADRVAGFVNLPAAKALADHALDVDPQFAPAITARNNIASEQQALDAAVVKGKGLVAAQRYDEGYAAILPYRQFADEEPGVGEIVAAAYKRHIDLGAQAAAAKDWGKAVAEFQHAFDIAPDPKAKSLLADAQSQKTAADNKAAADRASAASQDAIASKDIIGAYEVLDDLPDAQRKLVDDQMETLQAPYVQAATERARQLEKAHMPIKGRADEDAVRQAYAYLSRASKLSDNEDIKLQLDLLSETIGDYYVAVAKRYMDKPMSSEVPLGWAYLGEAQQYRPNLDTARDMKTQIGPAYQIKAKLSIGVLFLDQTSRRDSAGFADQLQDAIATGLETSGLPVKVIRPSNSTATSADLLPNFYLIGEIKEHRPIQNVAPETLTSKYRSGEREVPNDAWNKLDQEYEAANQTLQTQQAIVAAAAAKKNKKLMDDAEAKLTDAEQAAQAIRAKLNATPKTIQEDVIRPYNYKKETIELADVVELSFRITDSTRTEMVEGPVSIVENQPKKFVVLSNIKPEDTEGVVEKDAAPNYDQLMTEVEIEARDNLEKAALEKVQQLPGKVLAYARAKKADNDLDGAANYYLLYLNCTAPGETPERMEASLFNSEYFNIRHALAFSAAQ